MLENTVPAYRTNASLVAAAFAVATIQLAIFPVIFLPEVDVVSVAVADMVTIVVTVLLSLTTPFIRALLHEAIHGRLMRARHWNDRIGRALAVCSGIAFDAIRLGHMTHHRFPRHSLDRADIIEPGRSRFAAGVKFYCGLIGWLYVREFLSSMMMLLPRRAINRIAERALAKDDVLHGALRRGLDKRIGRIRFDSIFVIVIYGGAFYLYGVWWPVLLMAIALRGLIVSLQDNVAHYDTPAIVGAAAHNTRISRWASLFMLNQNFHGVHHDQPELPWHVLPSAFSRSGIGYSGGYFALLLRQFYGPLRRPESEGAAK